MYVVVEKFIKNFMKARLMFTSEEATTHVINE